MNPTSRAIAVVFVLVSAAACTTYPGDRLLRLPEQSSTRDESRIISKAKGGVTHILDRLAIPEETKASLEKIAPKSVIRETKPLELTSVDSQLVVAGANLRIAFATNSIIIATGAVHISHSGNNVVVCSNDVDISHDGSLGNGSLVISKGKTTISHAGNTLIYAIRGAAISHAHNVKAFNTDERITSWGHINNVLVKPLFEEEVAPNKALRPTGSAGG